LEFAPIIPSVSFYATKGDSLPSSSTHSHQPLDTRIPIFHEFNNARFVDGGVNLEEDVLGLCHDGVVGGFERGEESGDVGGVDSIFYVERNGGPGEAKTGQMEGG